jgi:hypothetical protein
MNLAALLYAAQRDRYEADNRVEQMLGGLFPGWTQWEFVSPDGIAVFGALDSDRAHAALNANGFKSVTLHDHTAKQRPLTCTCRTRDVL